MENDQCICIGHSARVEDLYESTNTEIEFVFILSLRFNPCSTLQTLYLEKGLALPTLPLMADLDVEPSMGDLEIAIKELSVPWNRQHRNSVQKQGRQR